MLLDALEDVRLESLDYNAQTDIVLAKLNYLKGIFSLFMIIKGTQSQN